MAKLTIQRRAHPRKGFTKNVNGKVVRVDPTIVSGVQYKSKDLGCPGRVKPRRRIRVTDKITLIKT